jgi:hypothetical protein
MSTPMPIFYHTYQEGFIWSGPWKIAGQFYIVSTEERADSHHLNLFTSCKRFCCLGEYK